MQKNNGIPQWYALVLGSLSSKTNAIAKASVPKIVVVKTPSTPNTKNSAARNEPPFPIPDSIFGI